jgi:hypothetical protein
MPPKQNDGAKGKRKKAEAAKCSLPPKPAAPGIQATRGKTLVTSSHGVPPQQFPAASSGRMGRPKAGRQSEIDPYAFHCSFSSFTEVLNENNVALSFTGNYDIDIGGALYCSVPDCKCNPSAALWTNTGFITPSHLAIHEMMCHGATLSDVYAKDYDTFYPQGAPPHEPSLEWALHSVLGCPTERSKC